MVRSAPTAPASPMADACAAIARRQLGRSNKRRGVEVEEIVAQRLRGMGLLMVERIAQPFHLRRAAGKVVGVRYSAPVSGDIRAVEQGGRSVLIECKHRPDRLAFAALERHQVDALTRHHQCGGLSLLAWSDGATIHIMAWPVAGLVSGASIAPEQAEAAAWRQGRA